MFAIPGIPILLHLVSSLRYGFHSRGARFDSYIKDSRNMTVVKDSGLESILTSTVTKVCVFKHLGGQRIL